MAGLRLVEVTLKQAIVDLEVEQMSLDWQISGHLLVRLPEAPQQSSREHIHIVRIVLVVQQ